MRRMEAEVLNDTLLLVSGRLDETRYGVPEPVLLRDDGLVTPIELDNRWRRSIYMEQRRTQIPTLLDNFDLPPMAPNCVERPESTVSLQALYLMNNGMVRRLADSLANRIMREVGHDTHKQIESLYWMAVSRPPTAEETKASLEALTKLTGLEAEPRALAELCHTVFNSAAFIYID